MFATVNTAAQPKKKSSDNLPEKESTIEKNGKDDKKEVSAKDDKKLDFEFGKTNIVEEKKSDVEDKKGEEKNTEGKSEEKEGEATSDEGQDATTTVQVENESKEEKKEEQGGGRLTEMAMPELDGGEKKVIENHATTIQSNNEIILSSATESQKDKEQKIKGLSSNEKKKEDAPTKRVKAEAAVVEKVEDKQSEANAGLVDKMAEEKADPVEKTAAMSTVNTTLLELMPKTLEDVDNFKKNKVASKVSGKVGSDIDAKAGGIDATFGKISEPAKADNPKESIPLGEIEEATETRKISLGADIVKPASEEAVDLSAYNDESENLMKKEGLTQEQLDMVDSGELAEAKTEKEGIKEKVESEPKAIRDEEKSLSDTVTQELDKKEQDGKKSMRSDREKGLKDSLTKQGETKTDLEKEKEAVTNEINTKYELANTQVQDKLKNLKETALTAFDKASNDASQTFESNVKTRMDDFKYKRYVGDGGIFDRGAGYALRLKDWAMGIDDFPQVKEILTSERTTFIASIDNAITTITNDSQKTIVDCKLIITTAKAEIKTFVEGLKPALQGVGDKAQKEVEKKLADLDKKVNQAAEELKEALAEKRKEAIAAIDKRIEEMKEAMKGAISKLAGLLVDALLKLFKWALSKIGVSYESLKDIVSKGIKVVTSLVTSPGSFISNMISAVSGGISKFVDNFLTHLKNGFFEWLTGTVSGAGITLPDTWDLKGIFFFIGQVVGLGWDNLKEKLGIVVGKERIAQVEELIDKGEEGLEIAQKVKEEGIGGAIEIAKDSMESAKEAAVEEISQYTLTAIAKAAAAKVATLFIPGGAIIEIVRTIYDLVMWLINNIKRIISFFGAVFDSISAIASGAIGPAMEAIEKAMAKTIPIIISFLASITGLGNITKPIMEIIKKIRSKVDNILTSVATFIGSKLTKIFDRVKGALGFGAKGKEESFSQHTPEKQNQIDKGFEYLYSEENKQDTDKNDKLTLEQAQDIADRTKKKFSVFSSLNADIEGDELVYNYTASPKNKKGSGKKAENTDKVNGELLDEEKINSKDNLSISEKRDGKKLVGYKAKEETSKSSFDGIIVGEKGSSKPYIKERKEKKDFLYEFNKLKGLSLEDRRKLINKGAEEHENFEPIDISISSKSEETIFVTYFYSNNAHDAGQQDFTVELSIADIGARKVKQVVWGHNLALKLPGTRGYTDSASIIKDEDYNIDLNSAHILADQFLGSGYKEALNLILTSKEFNQITMKNAEDHITGQIKRYMKENPLKYVTFDMRVEAIFEILKSDHLIDTLKSVKKGISQDHINAVLKKIQKSQHPRKCEIVEYHVGIYLDGVMSAGRSAKTDKEDIWLKELFK